MKEIDLVLARIIHDDEGEKQVFKYTYKPSAPKMEKKFEIQIHTTDPGAMSQNTGFPHEIGDSITLGIISKRAQNKLNVDKKEKE